jgi:uncharacterized membrane protein YecN with MAPEG domain
MSPHETVAASLALLALLLTALSLHVSRLRLRHRVSFGDGGHKDLLAAMRAHGNALEQSLLYAVLALAAVALPGASPRALAVSAMVFVAARVLHAAALFGRRLLLRQAAHVASTLVHLALATTIGAALWLR